MTKRRLCFSCGEVQIDRDSIYCDVCIADIARQRPNRYLSAQRWMRTRQRMRVFNDAGLSFCAKALASRFATVIDVRRASDDDLLKTKGIGPNTIKRIRKIVPHASPYADELAENYAIWDMGS